MSVWRTWWVFYHHVRRARHRNLAARHETKYYVHGRLSERGRKPRPVKESTP